MPVCPSCGFHNPEGFRFCGSCGLALGRRCSNCGAEVPPGLRFCGQCGTAVDAAAAEVPAHAAPPAPQAERRLVSVLFADLVGFTSLSEERDPEEVRDLLTRYFETSRRLISRYGGAVEKFIGDAVMAVWGTPVAQEDDAERAVRAALDLVEAISALGAEVGAPDLNARAAVLTGEAAVTLGAEGQGMVAGDLVNTASRVQGLAPPGAVVVGDSTRRATEAAVAYEDAGSHELKGKAEPMPLWRAVRVVGGVRGALKSVGLEAPFVGRERELRLVKELFHASAEEGKAHLLSVVGIAGIGKSRLSWEFYKYIDGIAEIIYWHRGRCLAYGEGITYWALAEMVRMRARIAEGEEPDAARAKLRAAVEEHLPDPEERQWVEPRLAHLLGLQELSVKDQQELFPAWRLFFERLAEKNPTVMVFEDLQWADRALLDFVEYLLEWSRNHSLFVMTLARPELSERYPNWGAGKRNFTSLYLEPLSAEAMQALLAGLVPGLPERLRGEILAHAEGIPLYAVETVRMLIDRGLLVQDDSRYRPAGLIETLEVPETLQALIAARLDGLRPEERRLVQDASVLGKTFTLSALSALTSLPADEIQRLLDSLVRKEIFGTQSDPRSPERGQYGFLQDLVKRVAHETLSKRERKTKHLAVARYLEAVHTAEEDELLQIAASHYLVAYRLAPEAPDASEIKQRAREALVRAGHRAASLAASDLAQSYLEDALGLADDPVERAELGERAGEMAMRAARDEQAAAHFDRAIEVFRQAGRSHAAARVSARLAEIIWRKGDLDQAIEGMEAAFAVLSAEEPDQDVAALAAQLARLHFFKGEPSLMTERVDYALEVAESLWLPEVLSHALNTKWLILSVRGRHEEGTALLKRSLEIALENDIPTAALRAYNNLVVAMVEHDRYDEALGYARQGLAHARKVGDRVWEWLLLGQVMGQLEFLGEWDESLALAQEFPSLDEVPGAKLALTFILPAQITIQANRGNVEDAERLLAELSDSRDSTDLQDRAGYAVLEAAVLGAKGMHADRLRAAERGIEPLRTLGLRHPWIRLAIVEAAEAALHLGDLGTVESLLALVDSERSARVPQFLRGHMARFKALLASRRGQNDDVEAGFKAAAGLFREIGLPLDLGVTLLGHGEWLVEHGRTGDAAPLLSEARDVFERLRAQPLLERASRLLGAPISVRTG